MQPENHGATERVDYAAYPDARGHFGPYGGSFVAETLMAPLAELAAAYERYRVDPEFVAEVLGVSAPTVKRDARFARAFIGERLGWQTPA